MPKTSLDLLGAVFDWDGIIIDSAEQHREAWAILAKELGKPLSDDFFRKTFGMRNEQIIPDFTPGPNLANTRKSLNWPTAKKLSTARWFAVTASSRWMEWWSFLRH